MNKSDSVINYAAALLDFQAKVPKITKDSANPFFKSSYASLPHIQQIIQPFLSECRLAYTHVPDGDQLITFIIHTLTGEYMSSSMDLNAVPEQHKEKDRNGVVTWRGDYFVSPQATGSAITYAKRQALVAMLGLNIDEDDDGNTGSGRLQEPAAKAPAKKDLVPLTPTAPAWKDAIKYLKEGGKIEAIEKNYTLSKSDRELLLSEAV